MCVSRFCRTKYDDDDHDYDYDDDDDDDNDAVSYTHLTLPTILLV